MPSLSALNEFRNSFSNIAKEREDVEKRKLPYTSLDLPTTEAPPFERPSREASPSAGFSLDSPADSAGSSTDAGMGNFDFSAFLGSVPTDDTSPPQDNISGTSFDDLFNDTTASAGDELPSSDDLLGSLGLPSTEEPLPDNDFLDSLGSGASFGSGTSLGSETSSDDTFPADDFLSSLGTETQSSDDASLKSTASSDLPEDDDFSVPADLLSGLSDEIESSPVDFPADESPDNDFPIEDFSSGDFSAENSSLDDLLTDVPEEEEREEGLDLGGERQDGSFTTDSSSDGFFAPEASSAADESPEPDLDLPDESVSANTHILDEPETDSFESDSFESDSDTLETEMLPPDFDLPDTFESDVDSDAEEQIDLGGEQPDIDSGPSASGDFDDLQGSSLLGSSLPDSSLPDMSFNTEESSLGDFEFDSGDSLPDTDFSGESEFTPTEFDGSLLGSSLPDMDFDTTEQPLAADSDFGIDAESDMEESGELPGSELPGSELPDMSGFGEDFASESIDLENETEPEPPVSVAFTDDDFALPGLDEIFEKSKLDLTPQPKPKKGFFRRRKAEVIEEPESEDTDEIQLSQADVDKLLATLRSYPLNLRVACEELIAEQVILPQQLSKLIRYLIRGAHVKEMAELAGEILGKEIVIPKSYEKSTGEAWEAEKSSFAYIFVHNFLPVLRVVALAAALLVSTIFLGYKFIYLPVKAESLYKRGYERIDAGEYQRANELFQEASNLHRKKKWFYTYAEGFRDQRRYLLAENKYDELLRFYPRDKKGILDYAGLETYYLLNYEKANRILQHELLDYAPNDFDGLLASGDNFLAWADSDPTKFYDKYEDARFAYARILQGGWTGPVLERMMLYFIRTDNLKETLNLRAWFENNRKKYKLSTPSLAELGGYLLDKQLEPAKGVRDPYIESIESVRNLLLQAVREDQYLPEPHYHLARYYKSLGNTYEERLTLENAIRAFDLAKRESVRRRLNRVDTHYRYANLLVNSKEFFRAEEQYVRGIELYEDFVSRNLISPSAQLGQLYAGVGDLEYFVKSGNIQAALNNYHTAEKYGWSPPEIQYRMGAAYYQQEKWGNALDYLFKAAAELPLNRRILFALGNTAYKRGDYFAAQGYYSRLLDILENQRVRLPVLLPNDNPQFLELGERLMMARNNAGVVYEALAKQTGNREYRSRALSLYADSARAWDSITRNPEFMTRMSVGDTPGAPGINLGYLNANNALHPSPSFNPEIFIRIDKDVSEPSRWEELAPFGGLAN
ncbi:MAG: tetratricopeptide repeat protein [Treponema sp.]|jgi:tetratricopeptide (TPR) repeat protein|nr:tetratricopeptide repeat protein [Treponema sp.]